MRFPFVTRAHHDEVVRLMREQLDRAEQERRTYLDRLGAAGLGGAFFSEPVEAAPQSAIEEIEDAEALEDRRLEALRRRPSALAAAVTRQIRRNRRHEASSDARGGHIRKMVDDDLDSAEAAGRRRQA